MGPDLPFFDVCGGSERRGKHHTKGKDVSLRAATHIIRSMIRNEASNALKWNETILEKKQTISLTSYT